MVAVPLMKRMGSRPIWSVKGTVPIGSMINFDSHIAGHGHGDPKYKQTFNEPCRRFWRLSSSIWSRHLVLCVYEYRWRFTVHIFLHENELSEVSVVVVCSRVLHIGAFFDNCELKWYEMRKFNILMPFYFVHIESILPLFRACVLVFLLILLFCIQLTICCIYKLVKMCHWIFLQSIICVLKLTCACATLSCLYLNFLKNFIFAQNLR